MSRYSYLPIDVGFDLRVHPDMAIRLPEDVAEVGVEYEDRAGEARIASGSRSEIAAALTAAGYRVEVEALP